MYGIICDIIYDNIYDIIIVCLTLSIASIVVALNANIERTKESNRMLDHILYLTNKVQTLEKEIAEIQEKEALQGNKGLQRKKKNGVKMKLKDSSVSLPLESSPRPHTF